MEGEACLSRVGSLGVHFHFCDTSWNLPLSMGSWSLRSLFVVSHRWSFPTALCLSEGEGDIGGGGVCVAQQRDPGQNGLVW